MLAIKQMTDTGKWLFQTDSNHQTNLQRKKIYKSWKMQYIRDCTVVQIACIRDCVWGNLRICGFTQRNKRVYASVSKKNSIYENFKKNKKDKLKKLAKLKVQKQTRQQQQANRQLSLDWLENTQTRNNKSVFPSGVANSVGGKCSPRAFWVETLADSKLSIQRNIHSYNHYATISKFYDKGTYLRSYAWEGL